MKKFINKALNNSFLRSVYLKSVNKMNGNRIDVSSVHFKNNTCRISDHSFMSLGENSYLKNCIVDISGVDNNITIGKNCVIANSGKSNFLRVVGNNNRIVIEDDAKISLSQFSIVGDNNDIIIGSHFSAVYCELLIGDNGCSIIFGTNDTIHGRSSRIVNIEAYEKTSIKIGNDCMFSNDIQIHSSDSHSITDIQHNRINYSEDICIGNHVWVCMRTVLLKGTQIASNSVIGAGTICNKKFSQENVIIAGNPAKIVKKNINWDRAFL